MEAVPGNLEDDIYSCNYFPRFKVRSGAFSGMKYWQRVGAEQERNKMQIECTRELWKW